MSKSISFISRFKIGTFIILASLLCLIALPFNAAQAATVIESFNPGLNPANYTTDPANTSDIGWVYTPIASYTLGRVEAKFATWAGGPVTVEFYQGIPTTFTLLASGSFTPVGGNIWEGVDLGTQVNVVAGQTYFVGFKNLNTSPTTNAAGTAPTAYYSSQALPPDNSYANSNPAVNPVFKPIVRFLTTQAEFSINDVTLNEGNAGTTSFTFTVTRSGDINTNVSVDVATADNTATIADNDYAALTTTVNFTAGGANTQIVTVLVNGDTTVEATETFFVNLTNPSTGSIITDSQGVGTITNDDTAVAPDITSTAPPDGTFGAFYSHTYLATGTTPITFSVPPGTLPPGLTLTAAGLLSGTPTATGNFTGTVTASNGTLPNATQNFNITIAAAPVAPDITSTAPPDGTFGAFYSHTYLATGTTPITFSVPPGTLPPGLTLTAAGLLSGTPTATGNFTGTVTASNGTLPNATQNFNITIAAAPVAPDITSTAPPDGTFGAFYSHTYLATGTTPITFSVPPGTLPPGLTLTAAGLLSGTPTATGNFTGTVTASNGTLPNATQNFNITIAAAPVAPDITSTAPPDGTFGAFYSHTYLATGTTPITFSVPPGTLPPGLTLTAAGLLSGTPTATGNFTGTVTASNGTLPNATQNFNITIAAAPVAPDITSTAPPDGTFGAFYSHTYLATGTTPITFSVPPGTLPPGLTLTAAGLLSGTPTATGNFTGTVTASNGTLPDATQNFNITIAAAPVGVTVAPSTLPNGTLGTAYNQTITASGGTGPYTFGVTAGTLPNGLTLTAAGVLSGTPSATATFNFTITATDTVAATGDQAYTIVIGTVPPPSTTVVTLPEPPPAPACSDTNFEEPGMIRTNFTNDADRAGLSCRLIASNGTYTTWLGGQLTNSAMIGDQTVLDFGVVAAVDVFSANGGSGFVGDVNVCLKGSGYMIYMNANNSPRIPQLWSAWTTPAFPGYTCTTLYAPGTVIMVSQKP